MNRMGRILPAVIATALLALALPTIASANDYCVQASCPGTDVDSIEDAFTLAAKADDADRVFLGDKVYTAKTAAGFVYGGNGPIEIIGAGRGRSVLTALSGTDGVLTLQGGAGSSVHDLTITLPPLANGYGLYTLNDARRIDVSEITQQQAKERGGVMLIWGGTLEDSEVRLDRSPDTTAVAFGAGGGAMRRSLASAGTGVLSWYGDSTVERSDVSGSQYGLRALGNVTTISNSLVHLTGDYGTGIRAETDGSDTTVNADGVTLTAPYVPDVVGAGASNSGQPTANVRINLTNSILRTGGGSLFAFASNAGQGHATVAASYSDYDPAYNTTTGVNASISEANVSNVGDTGFVDAIHGNLRLSAGSLLLDKGDPATAQALDLDGNPLVADGNGDGTARRDLGAYELQPEPAAGGGQPGGGSPPAGGPAADTKAPVISAFRASPSVFAIARARTPVAAGSARGTRLRYSLSEPARVSISVKRAIRRDGHVRYRTVGSLRRSGATGANTVRFSGRIGKRALRPGGYRAVITATDAAGNRGAPRTIRLRVTRP
jgi:hypothetical protein